MELLKNLTNITDEDFFKLHRELVQKVLEFFKEKGLPPSSWSIHFDFDDLEESVEYGIWHPGSDSSLELATPEGEILIWSM